MNNNKLLSVWCFAGLLFEMHFYIFTGCQPPECCADKKRRDGDRGRRVWRIRLLRRTVNEVNQRIFGAENGSH